MISFLIGFFFSLLMQDCSGVAKIVHFVNLCTYLTDYHIMEMLTFFFGLLHR